jgi:F-type H+-transporting ATPase subunit epsilon
MPLTLEIVTPEAKVYSDTIDTVVIPTVEGESAFSRATSRCSRRSSTANSASPRATATSFLAVGGGFAEIDGDRVRVLAEHAITEEKIDENAVEAALKRPSRNCRREGHGSQQYEHLQSLVRYSGVQLAVKRRRR